MGRRADGRADDQTVASISRCQFCVNVKIDVEQRERRADEDRHLVEAERFVHRLAIFQERAAKHQVLDDSALAMDDFGQDAGQVGGRNTCQKPQFSQIDAENGEFAAPAFAKRPAEWSRRRPAR